MKQACNHLSELAVKDDAQVESSYGYIQLSSYISCGGVVESWNEAGALLHIDKMDDGDRNDDDETASLMPFNIPPPSLSVFLLHFRILRGLLTTTENNNNKKIIFWTFFFRLLRFLFLFLPVENFVLLLVYISTPFWH